jgi:hypothetical protein
MIRFQQAAQAFHTNNLSGYSPELCPWLDDSAQSFMNPLVMIIIEVIVEYIPQLGFIGQDQFVQTLVFDGPHKSLCVGIHLWRRHRRRHRRYTSLLEHFFKRFREQRIPIQDQESLALEKALFHIRQIPGHLLHPVSIGIGMDPGDLHLPRCDNGHRSSDGIQTGRQHPKAGSASSGA